MKGDFLIIDTGIKQKDGYANIKRYEIFDVKSRYSVPTQSNNRAIIDFRQGETLNTNQLTGCIVSAIANGQVRGPEFYQVLKLYLDWEEQIKIIQTHLGGYLLEVGGQRITLETFLSTLAKYGDSIPFISPSGGPAE